MPRVKWTGDVRAAPQGDQFWAPGEERDVTDERWAELELNSTFVRVDVPPAEPVVPPASGAGAATASAGGPQSPEDQPATPAPPQEGGE